MSEHCRSVFEAEINNPANPRYPELFDEAANLPPRAAIVLDGVADIFLFRQSIDFGRLREASISIYGSGELFYDGKYNFSKPSFSVSVYDIPHGASILGFASGCDTNAVLPEAVIPRPDGSAKKMLSGDARQAILRVLRYGTIHGDFKSRGFDGYLGIDSLMEASRKCRIPHHFTDFISSGNGRL